MGTATAVPSTACTSDGADSDGASAPAFAGSTGTSSVENLTMRLLPSYSSQLRIDSALFPSALKPT